MPEDFTTSDLVEPTRQAFDAASSSEFDALMQFYSAAVWTVRHGRIVRAEFYTGGRSEALKAVGLAE